MKKQLTRYSVAIGVSAGLVVLFLYAQNFAALEEWPDRLRMLADGFTIPGVIFMLLAGLVWVASDGFFDGLTYSARWLATLLPFSKLKQERYYDYKMRKKADRDESEGGYGFLFFTGLGFFLVACIFIVLFYWI